MDTINAKAWRKKGFPKRILVIRLQAMGDVTITLPYIQALRNILPADTRIDYLTRKEYESIPAGIELFNHIYSIGGGRNFRKQFFLSFFLLPKILLRRYQVVIDLQNNQVSRLVRKSVMPDAWSEFDKKSPRAAGDRTNATIKAAGFEPINICTEFKLIKKTAENILVHHGWNKKDALVVLNPAGAFATRNWPIENYAAFSILWLQQFPQTKFIILGIDTVAEKATYLKSILKDNLVNLVHKTTPIEAFGIIQKTSFVLSEDSGLMHFAWVSGIPTLAMFGSTKSDWSRPLGKHSLFLSSSDLPCGNCMLENCKFGDVHCLTRYSPELVFEKAKELLSVNSGSVITK